MPYVIEAQLSASTMRPKTFSCIGLFTPFLFSFILVLCIYKGQNPFLVIQSMIQTDINPVIPTTTVWEDLSCAQQQVEENNRIPRQDSSQLTTRSSETDFTRTTNSSIKTAPARKSSSSNSLTHSYKKESDLRQQYERKPEKVPDIAAEMEKWYGMTNRYCILYTTNVLLQVNNFCMLIDMDS